MHDLEQHPDLLNKWSRTLRIGLIGFVCLLVASAILFAFVYAH